MILVRASAVILLLIFKLGQLQGACTYKEDTLAVITYSRAFAKLGLAKY